ncbi:SET domain-containing protein [Coraliomargarita parva]|uniref:SET domain-containing protein n=1 Tax=Coraliomargarita parva TaxID=3014050 RepID=UPI0022B42383|nr:SET domain-containing protein-lysine N-methyltransferase [Coraliomargarita parva]
MPKLKTWNEEHFEIRTSTIEGAGRGLFSKVRIEEGDTIGYYTGKIISEDEFHDPERPFSAYILWVCRTHIIDGVGPESNYTRFINHSDAPNAFLIVSSRWKSARFEALGTIEPGEEIFFNYGDDYWE